MLNAIVVSIRFILLILAGHKQVALENAALRQQLAVFKRNVPRPKLNDRDRLFWIGLYMIWQDWKSALMIVQPETVTSSQGGILQGDLFLTAENEKNETNRNRNRIQHAT